MKKDLFDISEEEADKLKEDVAVKLAYKMGIKTGVGVGTFLSIGGVVFLIVLLFALKGCGIL